MLAYRKSSYFEYFSIVFCSLSFLYFSKTLYRKHFLTNSASSYSALKNFDVYEEILKKYNAKIIDFKIVDGYVEAFIEKEGFDYEKFVNNECYFLEEIEGKFLITFKVIKKNFGNMIEMKDFKRTSKEIIIESFFFITNNNWFISINGQKFNQNYMKNENFEIVSISDVKIVIKTDYEIKEIFF